MTAVVDVLRTVPVDVDAIIKRLPMPLRELHPLRILFPPADHLHIAQGSLRPAARRAVRLTNPHDWLEFLDSTGTETAVLYPGGSMSSGKIVNADWAISVTRACNDWMHDTYLQASPRLKALGLLPLQRPEAAVEELRHIVKDLGMCGAALPSHGLKGSLGSHEFWPIYREAEALNCSLVVRGGIHGGLGFDDLNVYAPAHALAHPFAILISFASLLYNGVFDRYPRLRIGFIEGGAAWLFLAAERFDITHKDFPPYDLNGELLTLLPGEKVSDYIARRINQGQIFISCSGSEPLLPTAVKTFGIGAFMHSDFHHDLEVDAIKGDLQQLLNRDDLTESDKDAMVYGNPTRFYNLGG